MIDYSNVDLSAYISNFNSTRSFAIVFLESLGRAFGHPVNSIKRTDGRAINIHELARDLGLPDEKINYLPEHQQLFDVAFFKYKKCARIIFSLLTLCVSLPILLTGIWAFTTAWNTYLKPGILHGPDELNRLLLLLITEFFTLTVIVFYSDMLAIFAYRISRTLFLRPIAASFLSCQLVYLMYDLSHNDILSNPQKSDFCWRDSTD